MVRRSVFGLVALALSVLAVGSLATPASAQIIDPQIFVQQSGSSPAGGDPNIINNVGGFNVGVAGSHTLNDPLLVIVGVINGTSSTPSPSISFAGCAVPAACPAATVGTYGLTAQQASFTAASSGSAFDQFGLSSGGSESFVNWTAADAANGFGTPSSYELFAFAVPVSLNPSNSPITIDESGAPNGSFIIAYGCEGTAGTSPCSGGAIGQTVFTNTGLIDATTTVPEPGSLALLGTALLVLGFVGFLYSRRRSS